MIRIACWSNTPAARKWRFRGVNMWLKAITRPSTVLPEPSPSPKVPDPDARGPKGEGRLTDLNARAVMIAQIAGGGCEAASQAAPTQPIGVRTWRADRRWEPPPICEASRTPRRRSPTQVTLRRRSG